MFSKTITYLHNKSQQSGRAADQRNNQSHVKLLHTYFSMHLDSGTPQHTIATDIPTPRHQRFWRRENEAILDVCDPDMPRVRSSGGVLSVERRQDVGHSAEDVRVVVCCARILRRNENLCCQIEFDATLLSQRERPFCRTSRWRCI